MSQPVVGAIALVAYVGALVWAVAGDVTATNFRMWVARWGYVLHSWSRKGSSDEGSPEMALPKISVPATSLHGDRDTTQLRRYVSALPTTSGTTLALLHREIRNVTDEYLSSLSVSEYRGLSMLATAVQREVGRRLSA